MKPFWRYGEQGKTRLIVEAFEAVKGSISWDDENGAQIAVHQWLMDKGYFNGSNKKKSSNFKNPTFFWSKKNYDKYVALLNALLQQQFYDEVQADAKAYQDEQKRLMLAELDEALADIAKKYPHCGIGVPVVRSIDTWQDEFCGSFFQWALWSGVGFLGITAVFGKKKVG